MKEEDYEIFSCDLCGNTNAIELPRCREYTNGQVMHICKNCGFIYTKKRRSFKKVAETWNEELFGDPSVLKQSSYSALNPHVLARLTYILEFTDEHVGVDGKKVYDIGGGEGEFLRMAAKKGAEVFAIEPSKKNCVRMTELGIKNFVGTAEEFQKHVDTSSEKHKADIVTMMWTLECSQSPRKLVELAYNLLEDGGHIIIGTGSRILVPFKKPLHCFLSSNPLDTHPIHFSFNTLRGFLAESGFEVTNAHPYVENDILCVAAKKVGKDKKIEWEKDDYLKVEDFFNRWHKDSLLYR